MTGPWIPDILIVEDSYTDLRLLQKQLKEMGLINHVKVAVTLNEAMTMLKEQSYDLIIADMHLPDGLGTELLLFVSDWKLPPDVVLISGSIFSDAVKDVQHATEVGARYYIRKGVDNEVFKELLASAISDIRQTRPERGAAIGHAIVMTGERAAR